MDEIKKFDFGRDFVWGTATAAYQIEGGRNADGKGDSIWDICSNTPGKIRDGSNGDIACDSYHKLDEDLSLLQELGVNAYRFSVSWPRVLPNGIGKVNEKGVDYYNRLIDGLLERKITPYLTLYHWDLPQALQEKGGFLNENFPEWFLEYAKVIASRFGDRVKHFFTFNEPQNVLPSICPPCIQYSQKEQLVRIHNLLLAHGLAAKEIHKIDGAVVGYTSCGDIPMPQTDSPEEYELAKQEFFALNTEYPETCTSIYSEPIFNGKYPDRYYEEFKDIMPNIKPDDMKIISEPLDFWAQNTYSGYYVKAVKVGGKVVAQRIPYPCGAPINVLGWPILPKSVYYAVKYVYERYGKPVYMAENGTSLYDYVFNDGKVHDLARVEYIQNYLSELERAKKEGIDIKGYFYWSLLDNFEWFQGVAPRFGLVHVDYQTLKRTPKDSFYYFKSVIENCIKDK